MKIALFACNSKKKSCQAHSFFIVWHLGAIISPPPCHPLSFRAGVMWYFVFNTIGMQSGQKREKEMNYTSPRTAIWEVVRLGEFITRNQFFAYKCYVCWILKPIFALSYSQILRWSYAGAIIVIQVQEKTACHCLKKSLALLPSTQRA